MAARQVILANLAKVAQLTGDTVNIQNSLCLGLKQTIKAKQSQQVRINLQNRELTFTEH